MMMRKDTHTGPVGKLFNKKIAGRGERSTKKMRAKTKEKTGER
jgi:hypothetical protein